ncbi:MAG TPA: carbamoyltransferase C-terminal domain-containing protein [Pyrinomonadaceae bacterium]|nr:carbamoyltransferase C-terminal domain-containing protein [Pyrinomonadaceae bacterium]
MSTILGINTFHAGSSAAIIVDGVPVVALAEERLNRVKYYAGFPTAAIRKCLEIANVKLTELDAVAVGRDSSANLHKKLEFALRNPTQLLNFAKMRTKKKTFDDLRSLVAAELDADPATLNFKTYNIEHHLAHTASAYFASAWEKSAGITIDGSGDFVSCMLSDCEGSEIKPLKRVFVPHSLGTLYTAVCQFIGYPKYGDEGKVMGLAPLGTDVYPEFFEKMLRPADNGFTLNPAYFLPFGANQGMEINDAGEMVVHRLYSDLFIKELGQPREPYAEITQRDMDVAFGLQRVFEKYYMYLLNSLHKLVPTQRVSMAGGCALNSVANGKALIETPFRETCIQPAAGDDGLALGSALYVSNVLLKENKRWVMTDSYLGNEYSDAAVKAELDRYGVSYSELGREQLLDTTSEEIKNGNVVGWFQGKMEWGPRALGNRSILAHPGYPNMKDILNARIKHREAFRPFAPSVLVERQSELFEQDYPSPFMLHVYKIRPEWRERLSAVNHVDDTGRLQTVSREENPLYYDLIQNFETKTGIPVILNTSFNENEPIVCQPSEAIECFLRTKMDVLAIGSFFCKKAG